MTTFRLLDYMSGRVRLGPGIGPLPFRDLWTAPVRIQRKRTKGWRMPEGAVYVGRPSRWGNPYRAGDVGPRVAGTPAGDRLYYLDPILAVGAFERLTVPARLAVDADWFAPLRGHDLACWCHLCDAHRDGLPLGVACRECQPCHADFLVIEANRP